jgi:tripartite-type tricarboxylate transporter receptor subunit TctC
MKRLLYASLVLMFILCFMVLFNFLVFGKNGFPTGPITFLIGYPPGGPADVQSRGLAELLGKDLGQRVLVVAKEGISGGLMLSYLSRQKPDGYNIALTHGASIVGNPFLTKVDYSYKDFTYIIGVAPIVHFLSVRKDAPWKTFNELAGYAKKNPGKIRYGTYSPVSTTSFVMRLIAKERQIDWIHVPFKGDGPAITGLLGGHIEAVATSIGVVPFLKSGDLRALAVFGKNRSTEFPDVPTIYELGSKIPFISDRANLTAIIAPKGLVGEPFEKLTSAFKKAVQDPVFQEVWKQSCVPFEMLESKQLEKQIEESYKVFEEIYPQLLKEIQ